jgi:ketosteroid isomerase-like protein
MLRLLFFLVAASALGADVQKLKLELMAEDRKFARQAAARGVDGFADYLAEKDLLKFEGPGQPISTTREEARAALKKGWGDRPFLLRWEPLKADAAASGELGYTFGEWTIQGANGKVSKGHYVSIWKKQTDGTWKVVVDLGN